MHLTSILPHLTGVRVLRVLRQPTTLILEAAVRAGSARCPSCQRRSRRVHSRYTRSITDEPLGGQQVTIQLQVRRFRCTNSQCARRTFAEQLPRLAARSARRSVPLQTRLEDIGVTIGGRPGARFAGRRDIQVSRSTLLRLVRRLPVPPASTPTVLGIDDFAVRRGHRYGTVVVDLEAHRVVDLLPDRTAETTAAWLAKHGAPEIVCRDRAGAYADAARQAAPGAIQIADRFHLSRNAGETLERVLARHPEAVRAATEEEALPAAASPAPSAAPTAETRSDGAPPPADPRRERRHARYEQVVALHQQHVSITAISEQVGLSRPTVRKYVRAEGFPERAPRRTLLHAGATHTVYLQDRWAQGCRDAKALWQELRARGFRGSLRMVQRAVAGWRETPGRRGRHASLPAPEPRAALPRPRPLSPRQARWLLLRPVEDLTGEEGTMRSRLLAASPEIQTALSLVETFRQMVRTREQAALEPWLQEAETAGVPELQRFAASLRRDYAAVDAALAHPWSSGQVEGQVTKIKLIKRLMFGRGSFDLLRRRVLLAS
jgi:transposase